MRSRGDRFPVQDPLSLSGLRRGHTSLTRAQLNEWRPVRARRTITTVSTGQDESWQRRYEAGKARDEERNADWVQNRSGGPVTRTLVKEFPLLLLVWAIGLLILGWQAESRWSSLTGCGRPEEASRL
jgi:hypothetical protein